MGILIPGHISPWAHWSVGSSVLGHISPWAHRADPYLDSVSSDTTLMSRSHRTAVSSLTAGRTKRTAALSPYLPSRGRGGKGDKGGGGRGKGGLASKNFIILNIYVS